MPTILVKNTFACYSYFKANMTTILVKLFQKAEKRGEKNEK